MYIKSHPLARVFSGDKTISHPGLNRLGLQVFRMLAARAFYRIHPRAVDDRVESVVREVRQNGIVMIHDFLPPDTSVRGLAVRTDQKQKL